jgi:hypothetical protein
MRTKQKIIIDQRRLKELKGESYDGAKSKEELSYEDDPIRFLRALMPYYDFTPDPDLVKSIPHGLRLLLEDGSGQPRSNEVICRINIYLYENVFRASEPKPLFMMLVEIGVIDRLFPGLKEAGNENKKMMNYFLKAPLQLEEIYAGFLVLQHLDHFDKLSKREPFTDEMLLREIAFLSKDNPLYRVCFEAYHKRCQNFLEAQTDQLLVSEEMWKSFPKVTSLCDLFRTTIQKCKPKPQSEIHDIQSEAQPTLGPIQTDSDHQEFSLDSSFNRDFSCEGITMPPSVGFGACYSGYHDPSININSFVMHYMPGDWSQEYFVPEHFVPVHPVLVHQAHHTYVQHNPMHHVPHAHRYHGPGHHIYDAHRHHARVHHVHHEPVQWSPGSHSHGHHVHRHHSHSVHQGHNHSRDYQHGQLSRQSPAIATSHLQDPNSLPDAAPFSGATMSPQTPSRSSSASIQGHFGQRDINRRLTVNSDDHGQHDHRLSQTIKGNKRMP